MDIFFVDTNVFLRVIVRDDEEKYKLAVEFFRKIIREEIQAETSIGIIGEVVYVLGSKTLYDLTRSEINSKILPFLLLDNLLVPDKNIIISTLEYYTKSKLDFIDCYIICKVKSSENYKVFSFDKGVNKALE
jgi:predicted nucleic-acid-binding protein